MSMDDRIKTLEMLEDAVAKSTSRFGDLRKRADDLYEDRVRELMQEHGCDLAKAQYIASDDPTASRAYEMSLELAEREARATRAGLSASRYVE